MKPLFASLTFMFLLSVSSTAQPFDGYALYNAGGSSTVYLIDGDNDIAHSWSCSRAGNYAVLLKDNGNIVRGAQAGSTTLSGATAAGWIQEIAPDGSVVWEMEYNSPTYLNHHDISLVGDNVLITAWETKTSAEMTAAGYTGTRSQIWPTHFVEVAQKGTSDSGEIVWEWHLWDHLVQDADAGKANYGVVADHPELIDINVPVSIGGGPGGGGGDWIHANGVHHDPDLDLIVWSSRYLKEVFVIDHSTTTAEAASHTGGTYGKGGDILWRWGNPSNYDHSGPQLIDGPVHDARFIENDGRRPRAGWIQFFNNEGTSGGGSEINAIRPRITGTTFEYTTGVGFEPTSGADWTHFCRDDANGQSASDHTVYGNTFVCLSREYLYEVDTNENLVWSHSVSTSKAFKYACEHPGIQALLSSPCTMTYPSTGTSELVNVLFKVFPNPGTGKFMVSGFNQFEETRLRVTDLMGKVLLEQDDLNDIDISNAPSGMYLFTVEVEGEGSITEAVQLNR